MPPPATPPERTVSIAFVRSALRALDDAQRAEALAEAGIAPGLVIEPAARVPAAAFARLWMAVARLLDDEFFGLDARRMKVGTFAMLCHVLAGQATVGAALQQAVRGFGLFFDDIGASLRVAGGTATLTLSNRIAADRHDADALDARR
ncbi:MAG: AraC family transcriptional regulator, partial [Burkholderiales bacterium PBB5]